MLRVAFVAGTYQPDRCGVADYTARLRSALRDRSVESVVLTTRAVAQTATDPTVQGGVDGWQLKDLLPLAQAIRATPADVLHIQHAAGTYGFQRAIFLLPLLLRSLGDRKPIVTTVHEYGWWEWQPKNIPPQMLEWLKQWGQQRGWWDREDGFLLTNSRAIITTNLKAETEIHRRLPHLRDRVVRIPIAMNVEAISIDRTTARQHLRQQLGWSEAAKVITFFGFLHPVKGLETLLAAFQQISTQHPEVHLLLIGGVESLALPGEAAQHYWQQLQTQIANLNLIDRVHMTGYISAAEVSRYLTGADIGVLPFNHGVTLKSGSLLTLFAHKLPVIATRHEQVDAELANDRLLLSVPPRQVAALAAAIQVLLQNPAMHDRLAATAAKFVTSLNWETIAAKHLALYQRITFT